MKMKMETLYLSSPKNFLTWLVGLKETLSRSLRSATPCTSDELKEQLRLADLYWNRSDDN